MFKNHHPAYFFTQYLNTFVFSSPTQTQYSAPIESVAFPLCTKLTGVVQLGQRRLSAVCCLENGAGNSYDILRRCKLPKIET